MTPKQQEKFLAGRWKYAQLVVNQERPRRSFDDSERILQIKQEIDRCYQENQQPLLTLSFIHAIIYG